MSLRKRFEQKHVPEPNSGCWLWDAATNRNGYGVIQRGARGDGTELAHRVSYELHVGPIPDGLHVLHRCDVPACVNPDHLFVGDQVANMGDAANKGRCFKHDRRRLTSGQVRLVRRSKIPRATMARNLGVSQGVVQNVRNGNTYRDVE